MSRRHDAQDSTEINRKQVVLTHHHGASCTFAVSVRTPAVRVGAGSRVGHCPSAGCIVRLRQTVRRL